MISCLYTDTFPLVIYIATLTVQDMSSSQSVVILSGSQLGPPHLNTLLSALLDALHGRTWDGKVREGGKGVC